MGGSIKLAVGLLLFTVVLAAPSDKSNGDFEFVEDRAGSASSAVGSRTSSAPGTRTWLRDPNNALCSLLRCGKREICLLQDRFTAVCVDKTEVARSGDRVIPFHSSSSPSTKDSSKDSSDSDSYLGDDDDEYEEDESDDDFDEEDEDEDEYDYEEEEEEDEEEDEEMLRDDSSVVSSTSAPQSPMLDRQPFASKHCGDCPLTRPVFLCGSDNHTYSSNCRLHVHNCLHQAKVEVACKGFCPCREPGKHRSPSHRNSKNSLMAKLRATKQRQQKMERERANGMADLNSLNGVHGRPGGRKYKKAYGAGKRNKNKTIGSPANNVWGPNECSQDALAAMGNRMLDWFSVIMSDSRNGNVKQSGRAPSWCKREVAWMMGHLDSDASGHLQTKELYQLEHDDRERCIKPFLDRCDLDRDGSLSAREWCKCFDESERPCAALRTASQGLLGGYIPECDSEGWYRPTQCHGSVTLCWCVDRHGVELPNTRTHDKPHCEEAAAKASKSLSTSTKSHRVGDDEDEDMTMLEGSADMPLDI